MQKTMDHRPHFVGVITNKPEPVFIVTVKCWLLVVGDNTNNAQSIEFKPINLSIKEICEALAG